MAGPVAPISSGILNGIIETLKEKASGGSPGALGTVDRMSQSGSCPDRGGFTKAGRSLTKHGVGARPGNSAFPAATGNAQQINQTAQNLLDDILTDPQSVTTTGYRGRFGPTTEVMKPNGQGAVFNAAGDFLFFKE